MRFLTIPQGAAEAEVSLAIKTLLTNSSSVLWLVSGGSCIEPQCRIIQSLDDHEIATLRVMLVDERYGASGHPESNYAMLLAAGFKRKQLKFEDILANNRPFDETLGYFAGRLQENMASCGAVIATLGIGSDGHTAGILPMSPAASNQQSVAVGYDGHDFRRITVGLSTLTSLDAAYVFAYGGGKHQIVSKLLQQGTSVEQMPSQVLYESKSVTVYNDSIESEGEI